MCFQRIDVSHNTSARLVNHRMIKFHRGSANFVYHVLRQKEYVFIGTFEIDNKIDGEVEGKLESFDDVDGYACIKFSMIAEAQHISPFGRTLSYIDIANTDFLAFRLSNEDSFEPANPNECTYEVLASTKKLR